MGGAGILFRTLQLGDNVRPAVPRCAGGQGGRARQDVGAPPQRARRGAMPAPAGVSGCRGTAPRRARDTGVTPGHAAVGRWHAAGRPWLGPRCGQAGRPRKLAQSRDGRRGRFGNPPCPQHDHCGSACALCLLIADIYLIIEQAAFPASEPAPCWRPLPAPGPASCCAPRALLRAGGLLQDPARASPPGHGAAGRPRLCPGVRGVPPRLAELRGQRGAGPGSPRPQREAAEDTGRVGSARAAQMTLRWCSLLCG